MRRHGKAARLPGFQELENRILDDFAAMKSVLLLLPEHVPAGRVVDEVRALAEILGYYTREILAGHEDSPARCVESIASGLGLEDENGYKPKGVHGILSFDHLPDLILIRGLEEGPVSAAAHWTGLFSEWARASHSRANSGERPLMLFLALSGQGALLETPQPDLYLSVAHWWGFPSILETRLVCRTRLSGGNGKPLEGLWRESVLSSLCCGDPALLDTLEDGWDFSRMDALMPKLVDYAGVRGWSREEADRAARAVSGHGAAQGLKTNERPAAALKPSWARGLVFLTPERGVVLHTAALALLERCEDILHRIWAGQAELLLPLIDSFRLRICDHLSARYGESWPLRWAGPASHEELENVRRNARACQWGHLAAIFDASPELRRKAPLQKAILRARYVRNEMAHYKTISLSDFSMLMRCMEDAQAGL